MAIQTVKGWNVGKGLWSPMNLKVDSKSCANRSFHVAMDARGDIIFGEANNPTDKLIRSKMVSILEENFEEFWNSKTKYEALEMVWRRNYLLYGPPGTGKSSIIHNLSEIVGKKGGVTLHVSGVLINACDNIVRAIQNVEPDIPIMLVMEDIDVSILGAFNGREPAGLLNFLDGGRKASNVIVMVTTNHLERLSKRLVRPGRFDARIAVPEPDALSKLTYLSQITKQEIAPEEGTKWLEATKGFTFADLKAMVAQIYIMGKGFDDSLAYVQELRKGPQALGTGSSLDSGKGNYI